MQRVGLVQALSAVFGEIFDALKTLVNRLAAVLDAGRVKLATADQVIGLGVHTEKSGPNYQTNWTNLPSHSFLPISLPPLPDNLVIYP